MDPRDFLKLAHELSKQASSLAEARYRSSISRAYYSAFHTIKPISETLDPTIVTERSEVHEKVIRALKESGTHWVLGDKLYKLRRNRNTADYHLHETADHRLVKQSIALAENLIRQASRVSS